VECFAAKSRAGYGANKEQKTNQDAYIVIKGLNDIKNLWFFGVFDGHGVNGHLASNHVKDFLPCTFLHPTS